jgi:hypothetical protein
MHGTVMKRSIETQTKNATVLGRVGPMGMFIVEIDGCSRWASLFALQMSPAIFRLLPYSPQTIPVHPSYRLCDALLQLHGGLCVSEERKSRPLWTHRGLNLNVSDVGTRGPCSSLPEPLRRSRRGRLYGMVVVRHFVENNGTILWFYSCGVRWFSRVVFSWLFM